ncbi:MAG TPA: carbon starvation protein A, partial [Bacteroidetes bacterium]|nr:carbon starvation protein A [Bacteroidota bacterium]
LLAAGVVTAAKYHEYIGPHGGGPIALFAASVGGFMTKLGIPEHVGTTFAALAISAFALTSLDTATRLARFSFQEFFLTEEVSSWRLVATNRFFATAVSVAVAGVLALSGQWQAIWPIFGSANQLLAAIALLAVAVWLSRVKIGNLFVLLPMYFMFAVTISALVLLFIQNIGRQNYLLAVLALGLLVVALGLAGLAFSGMRKAEAAESGQVHAAAQK